MVHQNVKFISRLLLASLLAAIVMGLSTAPIDILTLKYNWITVAIFLVVYLFAIYLFYRIYLESVTNNHFKITKITAKPSARQLVVTVLAMVVMLILAAVQVKFVSDAVYPIAENVADLQALSQRSPILMALALGVFAPICEELIIRGNFFSYALAGRFDQPRYQLVTVIVNGVLFGLLRGGFSWVQLSYYTVMGLVLAATYILSGRDIRVNSVVHVTANLGLMLMA